MRLIHPTTEVGLRAVIALLRDRRACSARGDGRGAGADRKGIKKARRRSSVRSAITVTGGRSEG